MSALDTALLKAHAQQDTLLLMHLYTQAADETCDSDAAGFYLTHAYVFALEAGASEAPLLRQRLIEMGRESPD